jgi:hypothetical protein
MPVVFVRVKSPEGSLNIEEDDSKYLLLSAHYAFESESRARALGVDVDTLIQPRSGRDDRFVDLVKMVRIPGDDWRKRQSELDRVLEGVVQGARALSISLPANGASLSLRISFIAEEHEQLGYALASDFLSSWAELGGDIYIDS